MYQGSEKLVLLMMRKTSNLYLTASLAPRSHAELFRHWAETPTVIYQINLGLEIGID